MNTNQPIATDSQEELDAILDELQGARKEIDETNKVSRNTLDTLEKQIAATIVSLGKAHEELDQAEKEAEEKLDRIVLEQAEVLAGE